MSVNTAYSDSRKSKGFYAAVAFSFGVLAFVLANFSSLMVHFGILVAPVSPSLHIPLEAFGIVMITISCLLGMWFLHD